MDNKFCTYLKNRKESPFQFSIRSRIAYNTVKKALRGEYLRSDTIKKFIKYTKKELTLEDFICEDPLNDQD